MLLQVNLHEMLFAVEFFFQNNYIFIIINYQSCARVVKL